jgi:hypothetical protein
LGVFNYTDGDVVADLARKTGDILRCHNLVWHNQLAPWGIFPSPACPKFLLTKQNSNGRYLERRKPHLRPNPTRHRRSPPLGRPMLRLGRPKRSPQRRRDLSKRHLPASPRARLHQNRLPCRSCCRPVGEIVLQ